MTPPSPPSPPICPAYWKYEVTVADVSASQMKRFGHVLGSPCQNLCQPAQTSLLELTRPWIRERISLEVLAEVSAGRKEKTCSKVSKRVKQTVFVTIRCRVFSKCTSSRLFGRDATSAHFPQAPNATQGDFPPKKPSKKLLWPRCFAIFLINIIQTPTRVVVFFRHRVTEIVVHKGDECRKSKKNKKFSRPTQMKPLPVANTVKQTRLVWPCWWNVSNNLCDYVM